MSHAASLLLFDKHAETDFDTGKRDELELLKTAAQGFTGLDLGDAGGIRTEEDLIQLSAALTGGFDFDGARCDRLVAGVIQCINQL